MSRRSHLGILLAVAVVFFAAGVVFCAWVLTGDGSVSGLFHRVFRAAETEEKKGEDESDVSLTRNGGSGADASVAGSAAAGRMRLPGSGLDLFGPISGATPIAWRFFNGSLLAIMPWRWKNGFEVGGIADRTVRYDRLIVKYGRKNGVDPTLLKAVIWKESRFDRNSRGGMGELGLMQILPEGAVKDWMNNFQMEKLSDGMLMDPERNIEIGSWYLGRALERWKEYDECEALALCEYNAGFQRANEWKPLLHDGKVIPNIDIESTRKYVEDILEQRKAYQRDWDWEKIK